jgi:hypothetical protein
MPTTSGGVLMYDEAIDGDIASPPIGDPLTPNFDLGAGINTVTGSMTQDTRNLIDPVLFPHDFDSFAFTVPTNGTLSTLTITATEDYLRSVFTALPRGANHEDLLPDRWLAANPTHRWAIADRRKEERLAVTGRALVVVLA